MSEPVHARCPSLSVPGNSLAAQEVLQSPDVLCLYGLPKVCHLEHILLPALEVWRMSTTSSGHMPAVIASKLRVTMYRAGAAAAANLRPQHEAEGDRLHDCAPGI